MQPEQELLVVTQKGFGKRTKVEEYKLQTRGGKGLLTYDKSKFKKTGELIGAMVVSDDDEVLMINSDWNYHQNKSKRCLKTWTRYAGSAYYESCR